MTDSEDSADCGFVSVPRAAVEWLKTNYPVLCEKSGLCERVGGRLYTRTKLDESPPYSAGPFLENGWDK